MSAEANEIKADSEVRQKLKQVRFRHLKREIESRLRVTARNCIHNTSLEVRGAGVGFCTLKHVICDAGERKDQAPDCPNFGIRSSKEEIKAEFQALMDAPVHEIAAKYPDLAALTWVVGEGPTTDLLPGSTLVGSVKGVLLWADTEDEAESAKTEIANLVEASAAVLDAPRLLDVFENHIDGLSEQVTESAKHLDVIEARVASLHDDIEGFRRSLADAQSRSMVVQNATGTIPEKPTFFGWLKSVMPWR